MHIPQWIIEEQSAIESSIVQFFSERYETQGTILWEYERAMRYAVEWWGKRLRAILHRLTYEIVSGQRSPDFLMRSAIGIECLHAFTLVHDDLPCMDNDEYRRGKLTVWKKYGEALAVLVWDSLQTLGFELIVEIWSIEIVQLFLYALGDFGVARGQVRDIFLDPGFPLTIDALLSLHDEKTGGFIAASLVSGAVLAWADIWVQEKWSKLGYLMGRAFQIQDDILDIIGDPEKLGKTVWKDLEAGKGIIPLLTLEWTKSLLDQYEIEILWLVSDLGDDQRMRDIVDYIIHRDR